MNDIYVTKSGMTKEQMFRLRLINGFNFAPIIADAIVDLSKDFFQNDNSGVCNGQILYLAISDEEGPGKSVLDSKHVEVILTLDAPEDMEVYEKFGLSAYRQHILLRITQEARDQNALLTIKDLVKLLKSSYSTIKRDLKHFRERELYVPLRGIVKDIGPSSHESVAKVKEILQLDNLNVDFKYGYKIFTLNSGNRYLIKTKFILFVESNRLLRRSLLNWKIIE